MTDRANPKKQDLANQPGAVAGERRAPVDEDRKDQGLPVSHSAQSENEPPELVRLVLDLQAHAKEHGWQDADEPIAALLAWQCDGCYVIGSGYEAGFDAGYSKGYADGLDESAGDPRVERIEAGFKAMHEATNGEYSREDMIVMDALQAGRDFAIRLARREQHIQQLIIERGVHGETCPKAPHTNPSGGYLHAADDDRPYDVDGVKYCGRCHVAWP